ncbi:MFS transporter [Streptomyces barringtoniae]|uniref:MFS transporter n=1 Tax=Streptomyces barringtoniae TaxID=2892029 RepID=UPI001E5A7F19|nr:MFS transporter [Streptomyces barringtoniae]MCC5476709.1 MFS transporter [Streptomyces barringtoniae]
MTPTLLAPPAANRRHRGVLADRDFRLLYTADAAGRLGAQVSFLALPVLAQTVLHTGAAQVGVLSALGTVAFLIVGLPAGAWVDRMPKRTVLVAANLSRVALMGSIPVAWACGVLALQQLYVVVFLTGVATVFFDVAHLSYVPCLVGADRLVAANSRLAGLNQAADVSGRGVGGLVVQLLGPAAAVVVDALGFLWSAWWIARIRAVEPAPARRTAGPRLWAETAAGLRFVLGHPVLRALAVKGAVANLAIQLCQVSFVVLFTEELHLSAGLLGLLLSAGGVGGFLGALAASAAGRRLGHGRALWLVGAVTGPFALLTALMARGPMLWVGAAGWTVTLVQTGLANVLAVSTRQRVTPAAMLGRMNATFRFLLTGALSVGALLAGLIGTFAGVRAAICGGAVLIAAGWLVVFCSPLRNVRHLDELGT